MVGKKRDAWYAVAKSGQVRDQAVRRMLFGDAIVLFRSREGQVSALEDVCPHRSAPLSLGTVIDGEIQCRYHGFRFSHEGRCTLVPSMSAVAPALRVRSYPALERYGLIWLWPGEPGDADPARLFDWPYCSRPGWHTIITEEMIEAPVDLLIDNLLDLTHVQFVHAFGANLPVHQASKVETWLDEGILSFKCDLKGARYSNEAGSTEDRYLEIGGSFHAPAVAMTWGIAMDGTGNKAEGPHRHYFHTLAPEAPDRTRYFAVRSWNDCISPEDIEEAIAEDAGGLREDKEIIEACHATRRRLGASVKEHFVPADEVAVRGRRQFDAMSE